MKPLLTVIIPMYGVEKFIAKCLDSIIAQSYSNMEIICVNDGTKDRAAEIAEEYAKKDSRIQVLHNPQNMGLFRARVEGLKIAKGEYIAFVDADDYIGVDWYRLLIDKAVKEDADMVIGNTINVDENGYAYYYNNYRKFTTTHDTIENDDILRTFYDQEGACFVWHTVWNKVYSARLVKKCMPYFKLVDFHMIMGEDIAFSSVFYTHAKKLCFADADCYFYYRHSEASTSLSLPKEKIIKNIYDLGTVFDFAENCLKSFDSKLYDNYLPLIKNFKSRYQRIWRGNIWSAKIEEDPAALDAMESTFGCREGELPRPHDFYFYEMTTPWSARYEDAKKAICYEETDVVSFDIFDTLIVRPFYAPSDIYTLIGKAASKFEPAINEKNFPKMRLRAENVARSQSEYDDVSLSEIYGVFSELFGISKKISAEIQKQEEALEIKYCYAREGAKALFDLAKEVGKRVIITSDMYLEKSTVEKILSNNGYTGYESLFLSSDTRLLKADGKMYDFISKTLDIAPEKIIHFGDNWNSDVVSAQNCGWKTYFYPKCTETFENGISDIYAGHAAAPFKQRSLLPIDTPASMSQLPIRCAVATFANTCFSNPFDPFQEKSSFNGSSYYIGSYGLGIHLIGLAYWIFNEAKKNGYKKIVFLARDGKLLKNAFDYLCKKKGADIQTEYFYATRKALMPYSIKSANDFYKLNSIIELEKHTPEDVIDMFSSILKPLDEKARALYADQKVALDEAISSDEKYFTFVKALIDISYDQSLVDKSFEEASECFKNVFDSKTATFDIGYSGRLQSIICDLAGCSVDTFFVHTNGYNTVNSEKFPFNIHSYYDYTPTITGIIREYFISSPEPSCCGYRFENGTVIPLMEEADDRHAHDSTYAINEAQTAALELFCKYVDMFADMPDTFVARNSDYAISFDYMLLSAKEFDRYAFSNSVIEDEVYSGYSSQNLFDTWTWHLSVLNANPYEADKQVSYTDSASPLNIEHLGKLKKALIYLILDRCTLKAKFKEKFKKHKIFLAICKFFYSIPRFFYRAFKKIFRKK